MSVNYHITIIRMNEIDKWPGDEFLTGITKQQRSHWIEKYQLAILCHKNCFVSIFNEVAIFFVTLLECILRLLAVGNVKNCPDLPANFSMAISENRLIEDDLTHFTKRVFYL